MAMETTLNKIRDHHPCENGWEKLLKRLGKHKADDEPLSIETIIESNGVEDAIWCLRAVEGHDREIRLFAVWCARQVQNLITDQRSIAAIDVAERFANGDATTDELRTAREAAGAAAGAAGAAGAAAWAAREAAREAAWAAAGAAAWAAAWAAREAAGAAAGAAGAAAWAAQRNELLRICKEQRQNNGN